MSLEGRLVDGPARDVHGVKDAGLDLHRFGDEGLDDIGRYPGSSQPRGDLARLEIDRLHVLQRRGGGEETGIEIGLFSR